MSGPDFDLVVIDYTNWRGERSERIVAPKCISFGANEWHADPQWLLFAFDLKRGVFREFAMKDIHSWQPKGTEE